MALSGCKTLACTALQGETLCDHGGKRRAMKGIVPQRVYLSLVAADCHCRHRSSPHGVLAPLPGQAGLAVRASLCLVAKQTKWLCSRLDAGLYTAATRTTWHNSSPCHPANGSLAAPQIAMATGHLNGMGWDGACTAWAALCVELPDTHTQPLC